MHEVLNTIIFDKKLIINILASKYHVQNYRRYAVVIFLEFSAVLMKEMSLYYSTDFRKKRKKRLKMNWN